MSEDTNEDEKNSTNIGSNTKIEAEFGSLKLEVETEDKDECEVLFNETWDKIIEDVGNMSEGAREKLGRGLE